MQSEVAIPAGMVAWAGGVSLDTPHPADWSNGSVQLRSGKIVPILSECHTWGWKASSLVTYGTCPDDIIAYTPRTPTPASEDAAGLREALRPFTFEGVTIPRGLPADALWFTDSVTGKSFTIGQVLAARAALHSPADISAEVAVPVEQDTVAFVQSWLMNADYDPSQFDRDFAAAIDARCAASLPTTEASAGREKVAGMIALAGLGTNTGEPRRPHGDWKPDEFAARILEIIPSHALNQCYALADAILALVTPRPSAPGDQADAKRAIENRLTGLWSWLESISTYDWSEIVADGGITAGMVVQQEARGQRDKVQAIIEQVQRFPAIRPAALAAGGSR